MKKLHNWGIGHFKQPIYWVLSNFFRRHYQKYDSLEEAFFDKKVQVS